MVKMTDRSWPDWHRGIPLTEKGLRKLLKGWGLQTKRIRIGSERAGSSNLIRGYETGEVLEVAAHHVDVETTEEEIMEAVRSLPGYM